MQLQINGINLVSGFTDVLAAFADTQPTGMCSGTDENGNEITLVVTPILKSDFPMAGITTIAGGVYGIAVDPAQNTEIAQVVATVSTGNTAESALLTAPNGDTVTFSNFTGFPAQS